MLDSSDNASTIPSASTRIGGEHAPASGARVQQHALDQAREYLARVLPWPTDGEPGYVSLVWTVPGNGEKQKYWRDQAVRSVDEAEKLLKYVLSRSDTLDVYTCMSLQREAKPVTKKGFTFMSAGRGSQKNALALKSIFLDIDCKEKGYGNQKEAGAALAAFVKKLGLIPSTIVGSGGGFHCYWSVNRPLTPEEWQPLAEALKNAAMDAGLRFDSGCTIDSARVLRVPSTNNKKYNPPLPVKLAVGKKYTEYTYEQLKVALAPYMGKVTPKVTAPMLDPKLFPPRPPKTGVSELGAGIEKEEIRFDIDEVVRSVRSSKRRWTPGDAITITPCGTLRRSLAPSAWMAATQLTVWAKTILGTHRSQPTRFMIARLMKETRRVLAGHIARPSVIMGARRATAVPMSARANRRCILLYRGVLARDRLPHQVTRRSPLRQGHRHQRSQHR
jgi:hypothetical protein